MRLTGGSVITLEQSPSKIEMARKNLADAGVADHVQIKEGAALATLKALSVSHAEELEAFLARVKSHPDLFSVTLPVGNGEELSYKL